MTINIQRRSGGERTLLFAKTQKGADVQRLRCRLPLLSPPSFSRARCNESPPDSGRRCDVCLRHLGGADRNVLGTRIGRDARFLARREQRPSRLRSPRRAAAGAGAASTGTRGGGPAFRPRDNGALSGPQKGDGLPQLHARQGGDGGSLTRECPWIRASRPLRAQPLRAVLAGASLPAFSV